MSDHNMEPKIRELMELKRMKEELEAGNHHFGG